MSPMIVFQDIIRTTLAVLFIGFLITSSFMVLRPFLPALVWSTTIVIATWPLMVAVQERLRGKRGLAVAVMTVALLMLFVIPFTYAVMVIVDRSAQIVEWAKSMATWRLPPAPQALGHLPLVGAKLSAVWQQIAAGSQEEIAERLAPYAGMLATWFVAELGTFGVLLLHFLLTLVISAILYSHGETAAGGVCRFVRSLSGERGENAIRLAALSVRAVALGIIVTALVQSLLAGVGLAAAGIQYTALLTALIFMCAVMQLGPWPILIPTVIWLYWKGDPWWGTGMLVWTLVVGSLENVLRPMLIRRGANLPVVLIFAGVIGGLIAFGIIGLFIGPVLLAVTHTLVSAWIEDQEHAVLPELPADEKIFGDLSARESRPTEHLED